jgi:hypothetical protein
MQSRQTATSYRPDGASGCLAAPVRMRQLRHRPDSRYFNSGRLLSPCAEAFQVRLIATFHLKAKDGIAVTDEEICFHHPFALDVNLAARFEQVRRA